MDDDAGAEGAATRNEVPADELRTHDDWPVVAPGLQGQRDVYNAAAHDDDIDARVTEYDEC